MKLKTVKYPILVTDKIIKLAKDNNLICANYLEKGKYICVDVVESGYNIPHTASVIDDLDYAEKACDCHNSYIGYSKDEANKFISDSMSKSLS